MQKSTTVVNDEQSSLEKLSEWTINEIKRGLLGVNICVSPGSNLDGAHAAAETVLCLLRAEQAVDITDEIL